MKASMLRVDTMEGLEDFIVPLAVALLSAAVAIVYHVLYKMKVCQGRLQKTQRNMSQKLLFAIVSS